MVYKITKPDQRIVGSITLPASKSISNRLLIIRALCSEQFTIGNLSTSQDTLTLNHLLAENEMLKNAGDAGTPYRLLCAYLSITEGDWQLTGSERMKNRPIGPLVKSLQALGAEISYLEKEGYPPVQIKGKKIKGRTISASAAQSSQYISALMLIGPTLKGGLSIEIKGKVTSMPYIKMTMSLMRHYGVPVKMLDDVIRIPEMAYQPVDYVVEGDWSAASYYYALAALGQPVDLELIGLRWDSIQGDKAVLKLMESFGLKTSFNQYGVQITKSGNIEGTFVGDFTDEPDLAQTLIALCAAMDIEGEFSGLENLKIKETDRTEAMKLELAKVGRHLFEKNGAWHLMMISRFKKHGPIVFNTHNDHRMAMALSIFSMIFKEIFISEPMVIKKSNPDFWNHLDALDFTIEEIGSD